MQPPVKPCLYTAVAAELLDLRAQMCALQLWQTERPADDAFLSEAPFCIDTLEFTQWLQFVFIERMNGLIEQREPLPTSCDIAPMAEEYFRGINVSAPSLIAIIARVDDLLSRRSSAEFRRQELSS